MKKLRKNKYRLISILILIAIIVFAIIIGNNKVLQIAGAKENERKADINGTTDSRFTYTVNDDGTSITLTKYIGTDTDVTIPSTIDGYTVTSIGIGVFENCKSLTSVKMPSTLTRIGDSAFNSCTKLTSIEIPSSVTSIGEYAFNFCESLTNIEIPNGITSIEKGTFYGCRGLTSVKIPSSVTNIGNMAFLFCDGLINIEISSGVTNIEADAFRLCKGLTDIKIPSNVKNIGNGAFSNCFGLKNVEMANGVESIENGAFANCSLLESVKIPSSVKNIAEGVFSGSDNVTIYCESNSVAYQYAIDNDIPYELTNRALESISVKTKPSKTTYIQGESLNLTGGVLTLTYNNNTTETVNMTDSKVTISGFDSTTAGTKTVTVSYGGKTTTFTVTVNAKTLSSISVKTKPNKTTYKQGENLNLAGGQLTLTYNNNTTETVNMIDSKVTTSGFNNTTLGKQTITVSYEGKTTTFDINIIQNINYEENEDGGITITGGDETEVIIPEEINGKSVTEIGDKAFADRDDLISVDIPDSVTKIADSAFEGSDDVTIICNSGSKAEDFAKEKDMNYILKDKTVDSISIKKEPTKTTYVKDEEELDLKGGRILLKYTDGDTSPISMKFTGVKVTGYDKTKAGQQELTVTFREKTTTFNVTVNAKDEPILGDISGDGKVDSTDLLLLKRHIIAGNKTEWVLKEDKFTRGDMNTDGTINSTDLLLLKRKIINR